MSIFKAYDIRGIYGEDINEDIAYRIGRAYVLKFRPKDRMANKTRLMFFFMGIDRVIGL